MRRIGPYAIERELGRGGMGVVYAARDPRAHRVVALKLLSRSAALNDAALERFRREAEALAQVQHRGVVGIHDLGSAPQGFYIATDLIEGEPLSAVLKRGPLPPRRAVELLVELTDAVSALHARGLLHRDLKPGNVMVRPDGSPCLLDFGLVRSESAETLTQTGQLVGTPAYMSPEQADGALDRMGPTADVYSLGAVLFAALAGRPPHEGASPLHVVRAVFRDEPRWPPAPANLEAILRKAMAKRAEDRYPDCAALQADLRRFLTSEPTSAPRRTGAAAAAVGLALLAGLAVGVASLMTPAETTPPVATKPPDDPVPESTREPDPQPETTRPVPTLPKQTFPHRNVTRALFRPNGEGAYSCGADGWVNAWGFESERLRQIVGLRRVRVWAFALSPDGETLGLATEDFDRGGRVYVVDPTSGKAKLLHQAAETRFQAIAFSPDGSRLAVGHRQKILIFDHPSGALLRELGGFTGNVNELAFLPSGEALASAHGKPLDTLAAEGKAELRVWNTAGWTLKRTVSLHSMAHSVSCSPDSKRVAVACDNSQVKLLDLATGELTSLAGSGTEESDRDVTFLGRYGKGGAHNGVVHGVAFSPDGRRLYSIAQDRNELRAWDAGSGAELACVALARRPVYVACAPEGGRLLVCTRDPDGNPDRARVELWDLSALNRESGQ